jgi:carboxypeptidase T
MEEEIKTTINRHHRGLDNGLQFVSVLVALLLGLMTPGFISAAPPSVNLEPAGPVQAANPERSYDVHTYRVSNVNTKEDRTAIAWTGADIVEIGVNYVIVRAAEQEASQIAKLGYHIEELVQATDFPPADAAYHNYTEMSDEIPAVANAHPDIVSRFSNGFSGEDTDSVSVVP